MLIRQAFGADDDIRALMTQLWGSPRMALDGKLYDLTQYPCLICEDENGLMGFMHYEIRGEVCEILSLDCPRPHEGAGGRLLSSLPIIVGVYGVKRIIVVTTNDNTAALRFYQKNGFDIFEIRLNAVERSRALKPEIPELGDDDIPIRHEIVLQKNSSLMTNSKFIKRTVVERPPYNAQQGSM